MRSPTNPAASELKVAAVQFDMQVGLENKEKNLATTSSTSTRRPGPAHA